MAEAEVEAVKRGIEVFESRGFEAWLTEFVAPDAQFIQHPSMDIVDAPAIYHGWDGWRTAVAEWTEAFDEWQVLPGTVFDAGGSDVLLAWSDHGRGRESGLSVERPDNAFIHTLSQGKIVRTVQYGSEAEARMQAGLPPAD